jgi:hypothetical protein
MFSKVQVTGLKDKKIKTIYEMDQETFNNTYINPKQGNMCRYKSSDFVGKETKKENSSMLCAYSVMTIRNFRS